MWRIALISATVVAGAAFLAIADLRASSNAPHLVSATGEEAFAAAGRAATGTRICFGPARLTLGAPAPRLSFGGEGCGRAGRAMFGAARIEPPRAGTSLRI